ncbi:MAG: 4'-phosphopantetheinyl transferase superfamily protein, partial [Abditibacteriota bacterium]|nr:4'-phosphopantetheinyl transferase superfamily protein [Abditibacteriota bacterium]
SAMNTKVYFTILDDTVSTDAMYLASAPERRAKADALRLESDKRLSLAAGLMIRKLLGGIPVVTDLHGKPRAEGVFFNYSHSGDVVMFAISDCEVGCDVQKIGEVRLGAARRAFSEEELKELEGERDPEKRKTLFFRLWTMKESVVKMTGAGFAGGAKSFSAADYNVAEVPCPEGYAAALCAKKNREFSVRYLPISALI